MGCLGHVLRILPIIMWPHTLHSTFVRGRLHTHLPSSTFRETPLPRPSQPLLILWNTSSTLFVGLKNINFTSPSGCFPTGFPTNILHAFLVSLPVIHVWLIIISLIWLSNQYQSTDNVERNCHFPAGTTWLTAKCYKVFPIRVKYRSLGTIKSTCLNKSSK
jgi:hypothetical protein